VALAKLANRSTPMRLAKKAPFTGNGCDRLRRASGVDGEWHKSEQALSGMARRYLKIAATLFAVF